MQIYAAPLQGYTEAPWRHFHRLVYGEGVDCYFTPFLRIEGGDVRRKDLNDILSPLNEDVHVVPQIIFKDSDEFCALTDAAIDAGYKRIDLNLGCPFPPQVKKGRGSGMIGNRDVLAQIAELMISCHGEIEFSVKMRLGVESPDEWQSTIDIINSMPLHHVTIHPRTACQQYSGELQLNELQTFKERCTKPLIYNGDLSEISVMPGFEGIMIGRGLLARPSLVAEYLEGQAWSHEKRMGHILRLHRYLLDYYADCLCGDTQILSKIKPFWDYLEPEIGHKPAKAIRKSTTLAKYNSIIASFNFRN